MRSNPFAAWLAFALWTFGGSAAAQSVPRPSPADARTAAWAGVLDVRLPGDPPSRTARVAVHVPAGLDPRERFHVVAFFHGWGQCAARFVSDEPVDGRHCARGGEGEGGATLHDRAGTRSILIAPQVHSGRDVGLLRPDGFRTLLARLLRGEVGARLGGPRTLDDVEGVVLMAHSRGALTVDRVLAVGGVADKVSALVFFDGVMGSHAPHVRWLEEAPERRLGAVTGEVTRAVRHGLAITRAWEARHPGEASFRVDPFEDALRSHRVAVVHSTSPHAVIHREYFLPSLRALGLPPRER